VTPISQAPQPRQEQKPEARKELQKLNEPSDERKHEEEEDDYKEDYEEEPEEKEAPKEMKARVVISQIEEAFQELKFKVQAKGISSNDIHSFFFNPFKPKQ
jgi:hypothetical protein